MRSILSETLLTARAELDSLPHPSSQRVEPEVRAEGAEGEKTLALLEQYAELLLKSVERKLDTKTWSHSGSAEDEFNNAAEITSELEL